MMTMNTLNSVNLLRRIFKSSSITNTAHLLYSVFLPLACHPLLSSPEDEIQLQAYYTEHASSFLLKHHVTSPSTTPILGPSGPKALGTRLPPVAHFCIARSMLETNITHG